MSNNIATLHSSLNRKIESSIISKVFKCKRVNTSQLFIVFVVPRLHKSIANWSMDKYVRDIRLVSKNSNGFNRLVIDIIKSDEGERMTNDPGTGLVDVVWLETIWKPFIDSIRNDINICYELYNGWDVKKLDPDTIYTNYKNSNKL